MTATRNASIAARVPQDLRDELEARVDELKARGATYDGGRPVDLSYVVRHALRYALGRAVFHDLDRPPSVDAGSIGDRLTPLAELAAPAAHSNGTETERLAARDAWPRAESQARKVLELVDRRSPPQPDARDGVTSDEAVAEVGYSAQRRLHDLKRGRWVEPLELDGQRVRRRTRRGALADVYVLTAAARRELRAEARLV